MDFINLISVNVVVNEYNDSLYNNFMNFSILILFMMLAVPILLLIFEISGVSFEKTLIILSTFFILLALLKDSTIYTDQKIEKDD